MMIFLAVLGFGVLYAIARWYDARREAETLARMEKLRQHPEAVAGLVDGLIAARKRDTDALRKVQRGGDRF